MRMRWILLIAALPAFAASGVPGFPKKVGGPIDATPVLADIGGKGDTAIVAVAGHRLVAFGLDGHGIVGFPIDLGDGEKAIGDLAAADMDGDHRSEVAVATSHKLFLFSGGELVHGFPIASATGFAAGPSFGDLDGDGLPELLQGDQAGKLHAYKKSGHEVGGFPVDLGAPLTSSASVGRLRGAVAIAVGSEGGKVFVLDHAGKPLDGFPLVTHAGVTAPPAFGDIDDDGKPDLVVASADFKVYAASETGEPVAGFPVASGLSIHGSPALADLDGDGVLDVAYASADGSLNAVSGSGRPLPGFPVQLGPEIESGVAVADLAHDGTLDLVVGGSDGRLFAITAHGKPARGFPHSMGGGLVASPVIAPVNGKAVIFVAARDGSIAALQGPTVNGPGEPAIPWSTAGRDSARSGWFHPNPPRFKDLAILPKDPRTRDPLRAEWHFFSVDRASEPDATLTWVRNGKPVKELEGRKDLAAGTAHKGERWHFELALGSRVFKSPEVSVLNTAPTAPEVRLQPDPVTRKSGAKLQILTPSTDADGDKVSYRIVWMLDGAPASVTGEAFPGERLKKGKRLTAVVTASDGSADSAAVFADQVVANTPPAAPTVALSSPSPKKEDTLSVTIRKPATDLDGDPIHYRYRWTVNGEGRNFPLERAAAPLSPFKKGDRVGVSVTAFDGEAEGEAVKLEATVVNTTPLAPKIALEPAAPRMGQALRVAITTPAADPDGDPIAYHARWTRDGRPWSSAGDGLSVPGSEVKKGQRWSVSVTGNDGTAESPATSAETVIGDTLPAAPLVGIKPEHPTADRPLELDLQRASTDPDGDPVRYAYAWTVDGKVAGKDRTGLPAGEFRKHQRVRLTVTPSDGTLEGPVGTREVVIENSPPGAPVVTLDPPTPVAKNPLRAVIEKPAPDVDGDPPKYTFRWYREGALQPYGPDQAEVPAADIHKGDDWTVAVQASDGEATGPVAMAAARVGNTPPPTPTVSLSPERPRHGEGLRATVGAVADVDGDELSFRFAWARNGKAVPLPGTTSEVSGTDAAAPRKGELWSVDVFAFDGIAESAPAHAEVRIANSPPSTPSVALCGGPVNVGTPLEVKVLSPSTDPDSDPISYAYDWAVDGQDRAAWRGRRALGPRDLRKHERVRVSVTPSDGSDSGRPGAAECEVEDTPPSAPEIAIEPGEPSAETGAKVRIARPSQDPDGDALTYRYAWTRNGLPVGSSGASLGPGSIRRGDVLEVSVVAFDGEKEGSPSMASAVVRNTPPKAPRIRLTPEKAVTHSAIHCEAEVETKDADGDPIQVHRVWHRDGEPYPAAGESEQLPEGVVRKGERWGCEAWSDDGFATSDRVSAELSVSNSAPAAPQVALEPEAPTTQDEMVCRIAAEARDLDGDPLTYRYQWTRNGKPIPAGSDPARVAAGRAHRKERWGCTVRASDGSAEGPAGSAERVIANSPPSRARVALVPASPRAGQTLRCDVEEPSKDPDGDAVSYRFTWFKDGVAQDFAPTSTEVPGRLVHANDFWNCQVQPSDGDADGPVSHSNDVVVAPGTTEALR